MKKIDILTFVGQVYPEMEEVLVRDFCEVLLYHIEERIRQEVLHLDEKFDHENLILATPHDDVYWTYVLSMMYLVQKNMEAYREYRKLFEEAWENFCRQFFLKKDDFRFASWYYDGKEDV